MRHNLSEEYIKYAKSHGRATLNGDYKVGNSDAKKLKELYKKFSDNVNLAEEILPNLLENEDMSVRIWAASHMLALKLNIYQAEKVLIETSQIKEIGILAFNAKMTLRNWKEKGEVKF